MGTLKFTSWIALAVLACIALVGGAAHAQGHAQGLAAVGSIDPANGYPRWYMDRSGLQLGQCLDTTNPVDPCGVIAAGRPDPTQPILFPTNFPGEFFYWRTTAVITGIGGNGANKATLVLSTQGGFGGPTLTQADGNGSQVVFARYRVRVLPGGLVPGATYTVTSPMGVQSFVAVAGVAGGQINFTADQGCLPTPGAVPPPCDFSTVLPTTNAGPFLSWDPATAPLPVAGFIGQAAVPHTIIGSPFNTNIFRIEGPNVGGPGINVVETDQFNNVIGKIYVRPASTTSLISGPNPSSLGQAITLSATVNPSPGFPTPTGTVAFMDGATTLGSAALAGGTATFSISTLTAGSHSLTAVYSGDLESEPSTSNTVTQGVGAPGTITTLNATPNPSTFSQSVTLSVTVSAAPPAVGTPTGTVTFRDGAATIGVASLSGGSASISISSLTIGSHSLTAVYSGNGTFTTSTSNVVSQTVNKAVTTTSLTSSPNPSTLGQSVTLTASVSSLAPGTPSGTVTFMDGATSLGTAALSGGTASLSTSTLTVGSHSLTAIYGGDATFATSTSPAATQTVNKGNTTASLNSGPNPSVIGQSVTMTATVSPVSPATGTPTGTVTFMDGATALGTASLVGGSASLSTSALAVGSHSLTAVYGGSTTLNGSTSSAVSQTVNQGNTSTSLGSSLNPSTAGQSITLTATVSAVSPAAGTPTGTVTFMDGATPLATVSLAGGSATLSTSTLAVGSHSLTAVYNGSASFLGSTSPALNQTVNAATPPPGPITTSTTLSASATSIKPAFFVTFTATVTSNGGTPTGTVSFFDGITLLGTVNLNASGQAALITRRLQSLGDHSITAVYNGAGVFPGSTSPVVTVTVTP